MKYNHQLNRHDPDNGLYGDCVRTVISCLIDLEAKDVPNFFDQSVGADEAWNHARDWLAERGLAMFMSAHSGERKDIMANMAALNPGQYYMLMGLSHNGNGHVIICRDNDIEHDPSWTQQSVVKPYPDGYWIIATLVSKVMVS